MKHARRAADRLAARIEEFNSRNQIANQVTGGQKIVPMMNRPGSQNRKK